MPLLAAVGAQSWGVVAQHCPPLPGLSSAVPVLGRVPRAVP